jgi:endonuclease/exonuclease/phosphatase family metal-dependent hydrolase
MGIRNSRRPEVRVIPKFLRWSAIFLIVIASLVSGSVYLTTYHPDAIENETIISLAPAQQLIPGQQLKILSWNVQFFASRPNNKFFFDGGSDPWPSADMVTATAKAVANIIEQEDPDIILLQELDDGAERTRFHDQLQQLLDLLPERYAAHTSSFYWLADFVPHTELMWGVGMKMSIISKYRIEQAKRYALPAITTDDIFTRQFKPKRAIHGVYLPIEGGGKLHVLNTHLSAYAQGTDTMEHQVASVDKILRDIMAKGEPVVLAGDFNLIPTDAAYQDLGADSRRYYNAAGTEIAPLLQRYQSIPSLSETLSSNKQDWFTHIPNDKQSSMPDKTIDYVFYTGDLILGEHYVRSSGTLKISDHLPVVASFTVP